MESDESSLGGTTSACSTSWNGGSPQFDETSDSEDSLGWKTGLYRIRCIITYQNIRFVSHKINSITIESKVHNIMLLSNNIDFKGTNHTYELQQQIKVCVLIQ